MRRILPSNSICFCPVLQAVLAVQDPDMAFLSTPALFLEHCCQNQTFLEIGKSTDTKVKELLSATAYFCEIF